MISKNLIKLIKSLENKKYRQINQLFLAEGNKTVSDLLRSGFEIKIVIGTADFLRKEEGWISPGCEILEESQDRIRMASLQKNPQQAIALCRIPEYSTSSVNPERNLVLVLDTIQDPGNLGTIVRIADWFGIEDVVCSPDTSDIFNPRAVQASMGSAGRVRVHYTGLPEYLSQFSGPSVNITGAFLNGENLFTATLPKAGFLILGNEGNGISPAVEPFVRIKVRIPTFATSSHRAESLNVANAAAILCAEFRRRIC